MVGGQQGERERARLLGSIATLCRPLLHRAEKCRAVVEVQVAHRDIEERLGRNGSLEVRRVGQRKRSLEMRKSKGVVGIELVGPGKVQLGIQLRIAITVDSGQIAGE